MRGDQADFADRLRAVLPQTWFGAATPVRDALLAGFAAAWQDAYAQLDFVDNQTRLATAQGNFIDLFAAEFLSDTLPRHDQEGDDTYRARIARALLQPRATRASLTARLRDLTGNTPRIFEPSCPADTGAWGIACGYGTGGGWGSLAMPFQCFVTISRGRATGIAQLGGYNTGAPTAYASRSASRAPASDAEIMRAIAADLPLNATAWTAITA